MVKSLAFAFAVVGVLALWMGAHTTAQIDLPTASSAPASIWLPASSRDEPTREPQLNGSRTSTVPLVDSTKLHDVGPSSATTPYEDLSSEERRIVDRGRPDVMHASHQAFARAVTERELESAVRAAEHKLGVEHLGELGVQP